MVLKITKAKPTDPFESLLGQFGTWQLIIVATVPLIKFSTPWVLMSIVFLTPSSTFWCTRTGINTTFSGANNTCYEDCENYEYDVSPMENTIVSEWNLVCDRRWMASITQTAVQLGVLIGSTLFGFLSDRYGRKVPFLLSVASLIVISFAIPYSPNFTLFTILRFLAGLSHGGNMVVSIVILMEIVGSKYRGIVGCMYQIPHYIAHMSLSGFAYYFRNWDSYILAMAVPQVMYLGYFFLLPESPRWLVSKGRMEEAINVVKKAALMNKLPIANIDNTLKKLSIESSKQSSDKKLNYSQLFSPSLRKKTISVVCIWLVAGVNYYGLTQYIGQTSTNPFISVAIAGAVQIPSGLVAMWLTSQFSRRVTTATFFILESLCIIALGTVPDIFWLKLTFGSLGVSCAAIVGTTIYIQVSELYPTVVRNMAMGLGSTSMRAGSMIAPFVSNSTTAWLPTVIFGLVPVIAVLTTLCLPETKGKTMADGLEDGKE